MKCSVGAGLLVIVKLNCRDKKKVYNEGMEKKLTPKERIFVLEYLFDLNPERAAIAAGFAKTVAHTKAYQWVSNRKTKHHVYSAIQEAIMKREKRTERTADEVVRALWEMAELDIKHFMSVDEGGAISAIPLDQIPADKRKYINKIKGKRTIRESADGSTATMVAETEYFIPEKKGVYELLARHHGLLIDKSETKHTFDGELMSAVAARLAAKDSKKE